MRFRRLSSRVAPLCPAGHLPHKGGDRYAAPASANKDRRSVRYRANWGRRAILLPISPLVGEMSGRTEGGRCAFDANQWGRLF
ncbi:lytic murein transglycosylase [Rhizobium leguminosarum bv. viciae]|nr:lytic murein transglycosylase [Rhizobium leguminosarum bv. viciae]